LGRGQVGEWLAINWRLVLPNIKKQGILLANGWRLNYEELFGKE